MCRELAQQIAAAAKPLKRLLGLASVCLYGGVDKAQQVYCISPQHLCAHRGVEMAQQLCCISPEHLCTPRGVDKHSMCVATVYGTLHTQEV